MVQIINECNAILGTHEKELGSSIWNDYMKWSSRYIVKLKKQNEKQCV